jgi:hypothetical protein
MFVVSLPNRDGAEIWEGREVGGGDSPGSPLAVVLL